MNKSDVTFDLYSTFDVKAYSINCRRCGKFNISFGTLAIEQIKFNGRKHELSAWIRERNELKIEIPLLGEAECTRIISILPHYSPLEKQQKLLYNINRKSKFPGDTVSLSPLYDLPLAWAVSPKEIAYYFSSLEKRKLITQEYVGGIINIFKVIISPDGYDYFEKYSRDFEDKTQAFVAMSFSDVMRPIWENSIKPAIRDAGYTPYRVDDEPHSERIDVKIIAEIKNSRFVVADVTEQKHGVYFEAGFALGLKLPVIWCVKKEDLGNVHFDTRQYNHIAWESEKELKDQLYNFICAIIGKRSRANSENLQTTNSRP